MRFNNSLLVILIFIIIIGCKSQIISDHPANLIAECVQDAVNKKFNKHVEAFGVENVQKINIYQQFSGVESEMILNNTLEDSTKSAYAQLIARIEKSEIDEMFLKDNIYNSLPEYESLVKDGTIYLLLYDTCPNKIANENPSQNGLILLNKQYDRLTKLGKPTIKILKALFDITNFQNQYSRLSYLNLIIIYLGTTEMDDREELIEKNGLFYPKENN